MANLANNQKTRDKQKQTGLRIALYIRVSTEEQAENPEGSIKNQEDRLRATVKLKNMERYFGEIKAVYVEAKSGKNTKRGELQKLLTSIRKREIDLVMVTELSRISRSVKDFSEIWDMMQENKCGFYSLRENFDTTTAAGEMVLLIVATLAQFERRQISERVSANFSVRSKRGLFNGGAIPYGYKRNPEKRGYLDIDDNAAIVVKKAFAAFIREAALMPAARWLNEQRIVMTREREGGGSGGKRLGYFTVDNLQAMIRNKMYVGLKVYKQSDEVMETEAVWQPIIDMETFGLANEILSKNKKFSKINSEGENTRFPYMLPGLVSCKTCGDRLTGKSAYGRGGVKITYYEHSWATKKGSSIPGLKHECWPYRVPTQIIEHTVWQEMKKVLTSESIAKDLMGEAVRAHRLNPSSREVESHRQTVFSIDEKLETLSERLANLPKSISPTPIYRQMERFENMKLDAQKKLKQIEDGTSVLGQPAELKDYNLFRKVLQELLEDELSPHIKATITRYMVQWIKVHDNGIDINWAIGSDYVQSILVSLNEEGRNVVDLKSYKKERAGNSPESKNLSSSGSQRLTSGWVDAQCLNPNRYSVKLNHCY